MLQDLERRVSALESAQRQPSEALQASYLSINPTTGQITVGSTGSVLQAVNGAGFAAAGPEFPSKGSANLSSLTLPAGILTPLDVLAIIPGSLPAGTILQLNAGLVAGASGLASNITVALYQLTIAADNYNNAGKVAGSDVNLGPLPANSSETQSGGQFPLPQGLLAIGVTCAPAPAGTDWRFFASLYALSTIALP